MKCPPVKPKSSPAPTEDKKINLGGTQNHLFAVMLRRPANAEDPRTDPEYDLGYFGRTGCHSDNIMNKAYLQENVRAGDRFLFLQGGPSNIADASTFKIAFITPCLKGWQQESDGCCYIEWDSKWGAITSRPLKYENQLNILDHPQDSDFTERERKILKILNPKIVKDKRNTKAGRIVGYLRKKYVKILLTSEGARFIIELYNDHISRKSPENFITDNHESHP